MSVEKAAATYENSSVTNPNNEDISLETQNRLQKNIATRTRYIGLFRNIQKYSTIPITSYFCLHATNIIVLPLVASNNQVERFMEWTHTFLPINTAKWILFFAFTHIESGTLLKLFKIWNEADSRNLKGKNDYSVIKTFLLKFVKGRSPVSLSGSVFVFSVFFHLALIKFLPQYLGGLHTGIPFITWLLHNDSLFVRFGLGALPLIILIWGAIYHIVNGSAEFLGLKYNARNTFKSFANLLSIVGTITVFKFLLTKPIFQELEIPGFEKLISYFY
ncbi:hypothetical protein TBLA_0C01720 [Henningerozyma blattae CBS 6284]|uniref:Mitochondrial adapter protein MCP1 transmembrane domain-containing protein n=1 Tax=Henningerozyma blattae (strain ATCC 34711 / CBS 6284 / DSM 70876 / NBRC 10599 / NRRL Y-10934 / UCD 77-7) TaxID=1071380 RepID=I2H0T4_HENB6|nr:hypothetical protein TBLA_0C01720 [Tetrapisispora blattae CBS 6284]CCH59986.1 hypothetical protein TBLA_0C01720 [Tetrapisispora blattae CBS 6284]